MAVSVRRRRDESICVAETICQPDDRALGVQRQPPSEGVRPFSSDIKAGGDFL